MVERCFWPPERFCRLPSGSAPGRRAPRTKSAPWATSKPSTARLSGAFFRANCKLLHRAAEQLRRLRHKTDLGVQPPENSRSRAKSTHTAPPVVVVHASAGAPKLFAAARAAVIPSISPAVWKKADALHGVLARVRISETHAQTQCAAHRASPRQQRGSGINFPVPALRSRASRWPAPS